VDRPARVTRGGVNTPSEASRNLHVVDALQLSRALRYDKIPPHAADFRRIPLAVAKKRRMVRAANRAERFHFLALRQRDAPRAGLVPKAK
jgi:hypothetical protein